MKAFVYLMAYSLPLTLVGQSSSYDLMINPQMIIGGAEHKLTSNAYLLVILVCFALVMITAQCRSV